MTGGLDEVGNRFNFYNWVLFIITLLCMVLLYILYISDNEHESAAQKKSFLEFTFIVSKLTSKPLNRQLYTDMAAELTDRQNQVISDGTKTESFLLE